MKTFKLSPSSLSLLKECPRCFWLTQHGVWRRPSGPFPSLPSGMDRILKKHFDRFALRGILPPELKERSIFSKIKLFNDLKQLDIWRNNRKGVSYTDREGNVLHGAIDNLLVLDNKGIVLDYKTRGYPLKEDTHEHYQLQLDVYNFLFEKNGRAMEDFAFLVFYIPKEVTETGEVIFDTAIKKMSVNSKRAQEFWEKALDVLKGECPEKGCEWCQGVVV